MLTEPIRMPKLPRFLDRWLQDPPPHWVVEFSAAGIVRATTAEPFEMRSALLPENALEPSPVDANFRNLGQIQEAFRTLPMALPNGRPPQCALVLPDYSARVSVLDFDEFPASTDEQEPLVRFRLRKIVPYDLDSAQLSFQAQRLANGSFAVVTAVCPIPVLAEYETLLRQDRCHPGLVTSSTLALLPLMPSEGISVLAKQSGHVVTVAVCQGSTLRMVRTVEMIEVSWDEVLGLLHPTFAMVEDTMGEAPSSLMLCGFDADTEALTEALHKEFKVPVAPLQSPLGKPTALNAGVLGYLHGIREAVA